MTVNVGRTSSAPYGYPKFISPIPYFSNRSAISTKFQLHAGDLHVTYANKRTWGHVFNVPFVRVARPFTSRALNKRDCIWKSMRTMKMNRLPMMTHRLIHRRINIKNNHRKEQHVHRHRFDDELIAISIRLCKWFDRKPKDERKKVFRSSSNEREFHWGICR